MSAHDSKDGSGKESGGEYQEPDRHTFYAGRPQPEPEPELEPDVSAASTTSTRKTASIKAATTFTTINPSTAQPLCTIHTTPPHAIDAAVHDAETAFPAWASTPPAERARVLLRAASLLRERNDALARIETRDTGRPLSETAAVDVVTGADVLEYYAHLVASGGLDGRVTTRLRGSGGDVEASRNVWVYSTREPLGVCAGIGAWNYPLQIALWKSAPCLAAGNCMVYKPSEFTPLHAQRLAELYLEAGLPPGVFNVVYGAGDVGAHLARHPAVAKVSFTGQVSTGRKVAAAAGAGLKYATMELGGKSPLVVLPDADVAQAADGAMMANFYSSGQVCTNGTRVFVPRALKKRFERAVLERVAFVRAGDPLDMATNFGPLSSALHYEKVAAYVRRGIEEDKATLLCGGVGRPAGLADEQKGGFWLAPTVFTDCTDEMAIVRDEIFGPVMAILAYDTIDEVVRRANDTELGLAAGVFGKDLNLCHQVVARLEAGITWINTWGDSPAEMAVGGWKQSGLGVENGQLGLEAWVRNKSTLVDMGGAVSTVFAKI